MSRADGPHTGGRGNSGYGGSCWATVCHNAKLHRRGCKHCIGFFEPLLWQCDCCSSNLAQFSYLISTRRTGFLEGTLSQEHKYLVAVDCLAGLSASLWVGLQMPGVAQGDACICEGRVAGHMRTHSHSHALLLPSGRARETALGTH